MTEAADGDRRCIVCGGPVTQRNKYGICRRTKACQSASARAYFMKRVIPEKTCSVCGGPTEYDNKLGICRRNPKCSRAYSVTWRRGKNPPPRCGVCSGPLRRGVKSGICDTSTKCKRARNAANRQRAHDNIVGRIYGLHEGDYEKIYSSQGGRCAICQRATGKTRRLAVDHDHSVGNGKREAVRGLLCSFCNRTIGHARDNPEFFERAADYLRNPPARKVLT